MAQGCLKCLKYTMCVANFLCFVCGVAVLSFGVYLMVNFNFAGLTPSLASLNIPSMLLISGIIITCVSFLGFLGALKENRCLLMTFFLVIFILMLVELTAACLMLIYEAEIGEIVTRDLNKGLESARNNATKMSDWDIVQNTFKCCGVYNVSDWGNNIPGSCCMKAQCSSRDNASKTDQEYKEGCLKKLKEWFEDNFLTTGIAVIVLCIIEVLGMCFAMTLFCHISRSGLGYKL
ncbi:leukocyte surface antigen CD53-like [Gambusia affinis]|uniref:leukocyte surface antigen CD53-like n=1 Tax=Gambusia affinis TaxID=33528 RepID=UPI000F37311B|nr:leukocyte surface antigen CD53-like [Gambusia affinis]